jgi:hypothetical protein
MAAAGPGTKRCNRCGEIKPVGEFSRRAGRGDGRQYQCKQCDAKRHTTPSDKARHARYAEAHREEARAYQRRYYAASPYAAAPEVGRERKRAQVARLWAQVLAHYGEVCVCCGCGEAEQLTIDHINGGGGAHRRELFGNEAGGGQFYRWLVRSGFPEGYAPMCQPCNSSKGNGERCRLAH